MCRSAIACLLFSMVHQPSQRVVSSCQFFEAPVSLIRTFFCTCFLICRCFCFSLAVSCSLLHLHVSFPFLSFFLVPSSFCLFSPFVSPVCFPIFLLQLGNREWWSTIQRKTLLFVKLMANPSHSLDKAPLENPRFKASCTEFLRSFPRQAPGRAPKA